MSRDCCVALPRVAMGLSAGFLLWYFLIILTYYFSRLGDIYDVPFCD